VISCHDSCHGPWPSHLRITSRPTEEPINDLLKDRASDGAFQDHLAAELGVLMSAQFAVGFGWLAVDLLRSFRVACETS
jgi:hypothetical protein